MTMHVTIENEEQTAHGEESKTPAQIIAKLLSWRRNFGSIAAPGDRFGKIAEQLRDEDDLHVYSDNDTMRRSIDITAYRNARNKMTTHHAARFQDFDTDVKHDTVVLNPPFSKGNGTDAIIAKAMAMTANHGELLLIVPRHKAIHGCKPKRWLQRMYDEGCITDLHAYSYNEARELFSGAGASCMLLRWVKAATHSLTRVTNSFGEDFMVDQAAYLLPVVTEEHIALLAQRNEDYMRGGENVVHASVLDTHKQLRLTALTTSSMFYAVAAHRYKVNGDVLHAVHVKGAGPLPFEHSYRKAGK